MGAMWHGLSRSTPVLVLHKSATMDGGEGRRGYRDASAAERRRMYAADSHLPFEPPLVLLTYLQLQGRRTKSRSDDLTLVFASALLSPSAEFWPTQLRATMARYIEIIFKCVPIKY